MASKCCKCGIKLNYFDKWFRVSPTEIMCKNCNDKKEGDCEICGKDNYPYHEIKGKKVCSSCYFEIEDEKNKRKKGEMIEELSGVKTVQAKKVIIHEGEKDDALEILKKRLARSEISIDEFYEKVKFEKGKHNAMDVLRKRLAKGEITKEEFYDLVMLL